MATGDIRILKENGGGTYDETTLAGQVTQTHLADQYKARVAMSAVDVDWSAGYVFTKTIATNSTFTFSNLHVGVKVLEVTGNYTLALPSWVNIISGTYDGTADNLIQVVCTNAASGSEKGWAVISQEET